MQLTEAGLNDAEDIRQIHLQASDSAEAELVADLAVKLLRDKSAEQTISLVVTDGGAIIGHVALGPVFLQGSDQLIGYILVPLAVLPGQQNKSVGSAVVSYGLDMLSSSGAHIISVYGDPGYYTRFAFNTDLARAFAPPYILKYPEGWHALRGSAANITEGGTLRCVEPVNDAEP